MRDHIVSYQNDHRPSYWRGRALRQQARLRIDFSEIRRVVRFSTFATISANSGSELAVKRNGFHRGQSLIAIPPVRGVQAMLPVRTEIAQPPRATWPKKTKYPRHRHVSGQRTGSRKGLQEGA